MTFPDVPVRRVARIVNGGTPTPDESNWGGEVPWATPVDIGRSHGGLLRETDRTLTEVGLLSGSSLVPVDSILISSRAPIGYVARTAIPMAFNQGCKGLIPTHLVSSRFFAYALMHLGPAMAAAGTGTTFQELSSSELAALPIPCPPRDEQRAIADFLDRETAQIDTMVDTQERLVGLLDERRRAVVQRAATQGVRPAELTYSGYDSVGDIPKAWITQKLKRIVRTQPGGTPDTENFNYWADEPDAGVPWVAISDMSGRTRVKRTAKSLTEEGVASKRLHIGKPGTVLFAMYASVGEVSILDVPACWNQALLGLTPDFRVLDPKFLYYALHAVRNVLPLLYRSNTQNNLNAEQVSNLVLAVPPIDEQREIVCYLDHTTSHIDAVIAKTRESIALMKERRAALISAAVTGRIDVRTGVERAERDLEEVGA